MAVSLCSTANATLNPYEDSVTLRISFDVENGPGPVQWQNGTFCESYTAPPGGVSERFGCDKTATRLCSGSLNEWQIETNGCSCRQKVVELLLDRLVLQVGRVPPRVVPNAAPQKSAAQVFAFSPILMVTAVAIARLSVVAI